MEASSVAVGAALESEYLLEDKLGDTTGRVYRARRKSDGRLMVLRAFQIESQPLAAEFLEIAQLASRIRHPILANVEAFTREDDGTCVLVSEFVVGQRLDEWADEVGIPPLSQVIEMVRRLCLGLQAAARSGLAHDGLNPRNVIVVQPAQGTGPRLPIKLLDLGVPAFLRPRQPRPQALRFMSPEQLNALSSPDTAQIFRCNTTMNVYSTGCLLYLLCTGGPPYAGTTIEELRTAQSSGRLAPPQRINPQISPALNALILRALALDPRERFQSIGDLAEGLVSVVGSLQPIGRSSAVPPTSTSLRTAAPPPVVSSAPPDEDGPPTFKTPRLAEVREDETNPATITAHDQPTLPPGPPSDVELAAMAAGAPIGLFSSAPPFTERKSPVPAFSVTGERSPPLALFSEPPPAALTPLRAEASIVVTDAQPVRTLLVGPYDVNVAQRRHRQRRFALGLAFPLAALACIAAYFGVRLMVETPEPQTAALDAAAKGGDAIAVEAPVVPPEPPAANSGARPQAEPAPQVTGAVPPPDRAEIIVPETKRPAPQLASRERGHGHHGHESRGAEHASGAAEQSAREAPVIQPSDAQPPGSERGVDQEAPHAHAAIDDAQPRAVEIRHLEPSPVKTQPGVAKRETPTPALPLTAKVQIQDVAVHGSLPTSLVRRAVDRIRAQLTGCYARAAQSAGHNGFGDVSVTVQIDERGRARSPVARGGSLPQLDACVSEVTAKLVSEKAPDTGTVSASWKVTFTP